MTVPSLALLSLLACGGAEPSAVERVEPTLEQRLEAWAERHEIVAARLVVRRCDAVVLDHSVGAHKERALLAGSTSKWVSAAVVMSLVDDGLLDLDAPLATYIPELGPGAGAATLRQALSHTAGTPGKHPCLKAPFASLQACAIDASDPVRRPPGTAFDYGNVSYQVAAAAAERVANQPWAEIYEERIARPLGWERTRYGVLEGERNASVGGGLMTTPDEFPRFLQMMLDRGEWRGTRVLSEAAVAEMERGQTGGVRAVGHVPGSLKGADWPVYGLGVWRHHVAPDGTALQVGASGKFGFTAWIDRERSVAGMLAVQLSPDKLGARGRPLDIRRAVQAEYPTTPCQGG